MDKIKAVRKVVKRVRIDVLSMNDEQLKEHISNLPELPFTGIHFEDKSFCDIAADFLKEGDIRRTIKMAFGYLKKVTI